MKLSPQQAPLYGRCVITVQLTEEELALADDQHKYFLLFSGSTKRHLTSTQRSGHDALQALCPAHDCCEAVLVTLCSISPASDHYVDHVTPVAEQRFCFVQDLAFDMAQFLVSTAGRSDGLEGALLLDECHIPLRECERLDESLALALHHLALPPGWSLLGSTLSNSTDMDPQETLLHFSARRGLSQVTQFLLQQPGAKEALQLTNKQGFTPAAIAASKGHHCVHELFIRAEKDIEACNQTEPVQLVSTDAQLVCHLPRLNTHTLTLSIVPGRDPPSLQRGVEQLLHLICHLHAKGVSSLELQSDSLHTAAECCEDIDTEITSVEQQHTATAPECLEKRKQESGNENCFSRNSQSSADCGHDENGNSETDWGLCSWTPEVGKAEEPGLSSSQNWVCPASHSGSDYQRAEEEGRQWPVCSTHSVCDSSGAHEETVCVGTVPRAACGKQAEDTDTRDTGIQEGQEATEGRERSELETVGRPDRTHGKEETKSAEQITSSELTTVSIMGQSPSTDCSDMSDTSDCEVNCSHKEEEDTVESSVREEKQEDNEELTNFSGALGDQSPLLTDSGDVITACDSAFPSFLIEGLHYEGEPPPHTNSLEQNQETAGMDYAQEQQWGLSPETQCHSGNCSEISTAEEYVQCTEDTSAEVFHNVKSTDSTTEELNNLEETSCQTVPDAGASPADQPELIHVTSSDDDNSFQSVGSTTDIFDPTVQAQSEELSSTGVRTETSLVESCDTDSLTVDVELPSDSPIVNPRTVPDCSQTGTAPGHQLSPHSLTMEPLIVEAKGGKLTSDQCREELLEELENCVSSAIKADDSESTFNSSDKYVFTENSTSELERDSEDRALIKSKCDMKSLQNWETSTNESKVTLVATEGMPHSGNTTTLFTSQATAFSDDLEDMSTRTCSVTSESHCEGVFLLHSSNCTDEVSKAQNSPEQEYTEGDDTSVENTSLIHRDREATHGPYNSLQSESVQSFVLPTRSNSVTSCPSTYHRNSANDLESFMTAESGSDGIFKRIDEPLTGGDSISELSVSCSSTDDTASLGPSSSSPEESHGLGCHWSPEESIKAGPDTPDSAAGDAEEEAKDRVTEVPRRSCLLRNSPRSISPLRRHSWGPGKNCTGDVEMNRRALRRSGQQKATFYRRSERGCPHRGPCGGSVKLVSPLSYSLEGLSGVQEELRGSSCQSPQILEPSEMPHNDCDGRSSLMSLTENPVERVQLRRLDKQKSQRYRPMRNSCPPMTLPLTKSVSMLAISHRDIDVGCLRRKRRISFSFNLSPILTKSKSQLLYTESSSSDDDDGTSMRPFSCTSASLAYSISEEEPGPLRPDMEEKNLTKVGRTFSYLKSKMYKKTREKEREKNQKETKEKDKKSTNGHVFNLVGMSQSSQCSQCNKTFSGKEAYLCTYCNASVHKGCRDSLPVCSKVKMKLPKQQLTLPDSSSFPTVTMRNKTGATRERPWSAILSPEDSSSLIIPSRRHASLMFHGNNLSKSLSISNIAGPVLDEMPIRTLRYLSQSTDSLNRTNPVTESMESLTDEGTEMMDGQLMGEFEADAKDLEVDSWSFGVDQQFLQQLDKDLVKRQDIIYELMQTELHHIRTLRIMSEVYSKGLQKELQLETPTLDRLFPALEDLSELHSHYLLRLLERRRGCQQEGGAPEGTVIIHNIGDIVLSQFSGSSGENMKRVYGKFCSCHNEAVNFYKDLLTKDKRFKTFIKRKMSSSIVRRLGIPECILLVTQRITKYPVLLQRLLHHTKEGNEEHEDLTEALRLVKEVITAVDGKVNEHDKRRRLKDFHSRMDTKSIMMMKSGQIFAREDLLRRRLIHDGPLQLKSSQGRLKDVHALLLTDVFVFLHEKDQKYVFAMLDQRSTVISLQKLIVREVANEERGLFLITAGIEKPEMMEVLASSKDERNSWMQRIQDAMQSMDKDEDEGIPSETEDDKRQLETKAREMRDLLKQKDTEILSLLEEKVRLFRGMWEGLSSTEETCHQVGPFFRSDSSQEPPRGAAIMKDALLEVETLQALVSGSLGGAMASIQAAAGGPVCLPRRAETFGGFDSHQMLSNKSAAKDENLDTAGDLRRTGSDSVLKKGGNANLLHMLKRNSEQLLRSVSHLHLLLSSLQAVVVQQDSFIEDQRQALSERSSSGSSLSRPSSRPGSLIEQEKQRSLEKQRQELTSLHRQQAAHADERRKREKEWEQREQQIADKESLMHVQEEEILQQHNKMEQEKQELQNRKEEYQKDLERLRDAQRKLERDRETVQRQLDRMEELRLSERTPSTTSDDSQLVGSSQSLELEPMELSSVPSLRSKSKGKGLNPFTSSSTNASCKNSDANNQLSKGLLQLAKNKSKESKDRDKKKKKGKGAPPADGQQLQEAPLDGEIFFC